MTDTNDSNINVSQSTTEAEKRLGGLRNRRGILLVLVLGVVVAGAVFWLIQRSDEKSATTTPTATFKYDEELGGTLLAIHLLEGSNDGSGMEFKRPMNGFVYTDSPLNKSDPKLTPKSRDDPIVEQGNNIEFVTRSYTSPSEATNTALIAAKIVPASEASNFDKYNYFRDLIAKLVFSESDNASSVGLGMSTSTKFSNNNIKSNASVYEISATSPSGSDNSPIDHIIGQLVEVKGKRATYYLLITAVDENWNSSPKTWQAIKDSIKVDQ